MRALLIYLIRRRIIIIRLSANNTQEKIDIIVNVSFQAARQDQNYGRQKKPPSGHRGGAGTDGGLYFNLCEENDVQGCKGNVQYTDAS